MNPKTTPKDCYYLRPLLFALNLLLVSPMASAATLNVTNYGAAGDVTAIQVSTTNGSYFGVANTALDSGDIGKILVLTSAGANTASNQYQDFVAQITNVSGANLSFNRPAGNSTNLASGIYGTCSSTGFQAAVTAAVNGDTISVPAGNYLLIPPVWDTNWLQGSRRFTEGAVTIRKGGIRIVGTGNPTLTGNGAFQLTSDGNVYRGFIFTLVGPFTNSHSETLAFDGLTFDGGVTQGRTSNQGFPANIITGDGWDITHGALLVSGASPSEPPFGTNNVIVNSTFQRWRGEILKSTYDFVTGDFYGLTNCVFTDGNASAINIQYGSAVVGCTFSNLDLVMENSAGNVTVPLYFLNNTITNVRDGLVIQGALTSRAMSPYLVQSNVFQASGTPLGLGPAQNVTVRGNYFHDSNYGMLVGIFGGQGNAAISNVVFTGNTISNAEIAVLFYSGSHIAVTNNYMSGERPPSHFAEGPSGASIYFANNTAVSVRGGLEGSAAYDDPSNVFPFRDYGDNQGRTNSISYRYGYRHSITVTDPDSVWLLDDGSPSQIPSGASMVVSNGSGESISLSRSGLSQSNPIVLTNGYSAQFRWTNNVWQRALIGPSNIRPIGP